MRIKVVADGLAYCGISQYVRSIVKALLHGGHTIVYHHVNLYSDTRGASWLADMSFGEADIELYICNPFEHYVPLETSLPKYGLFFFEASLTWEMKEKIKGVKLLAPSLYCQDIFNVAGLHSSWIPFYPDIDVQTDLLDVKFEDKCVFFSNFSWQYRKGYDVLLQAYWRTFTKKDRVVLLLKTQCDVTYKKSDTIKGEIQHLKMMNGIIPMFKQGESDVADIALVINCLTDGQMQSLYKKSDCFVLPTRGEGLGLPLVEAMYFGLPIITSAHGGGMDFLTPENSWLVNGHMVPCMNMPGAVNKELMPNFTCRQEWFEPDVIHLSKLMGAFYNNWLDGIPWTSPLVSGMSPKPTLDKFTIERTASALEKALCK